MLGAISQIGEPCQSPFNAGFLTHLYLVGTDDVAFVYSPVGGSISQPNDAIGIQPGAIITELVVRTKTAVLSEATSENADGVVYQALITLPMKGAARNLTTWVHSNSKRRFILLTRDVLGNCYLIGSYGNGVRMSWSRQVNSQNSHQLSFTLFNWHPIQFIPTIDLEQMFPDSEYDYSFDLSFS